MSREDINFCCHLGGLILERELCSLEGAHCHLSNQAIFTLEYHNALLQNWEPHPYWWQRTFPDLLSRKHLSPLDHCGGPVNKHTTVTSFLGFISLGNVPLAQPIPTYRKNLLLCFARSAVTLREDINHCLTISIIFMLTSCHSEVG